MQICSADRVRSADNFKFAKATFLSSVEGHDYSQSERISDQVSGSKIALNNDRY